MDICDAPSVSRYKKNICRCDGCTEASREYHLARYHARQGGDIRSPDALKRLRLGADQAEWMAEGSCASPNVDPDLFFPQGREGGGSISDGRPYDEARRICDGCPVRDQCLAYALRHHEQHGMWGGKSPRERREIARRRRRNGLVAA